MPFINGPINISSSKSNDDRTLDISVMPYDSSIISIICKSTDMGIFSPARADGGFFGYVNGSRLILFYDYAHGGTNNFLYIDYNFDTGIATEKTIAWTSSVYSVYVYGTYNGKVVLGASSNFYFLDPDTMTLTYIASKPYNSTGSMQIFDQTAYWFANYSGLWRLNFSSNTFTKLCDSDSSYENTCIINADRDLCMFGDSYNLYKNFVTNSTISNCAYTFSGDSGWSLYHFRTAQKLTSDSRAIYSVRKYVGESGYTFYHEDIGGFIYITGVQTSGADVTIDAKFLTPHVSSFTYAKSPDKNGAVLQNDVSISQSNQYGNYYGPIPRVIDLNEDYVYEFLYQPSTIPYKLSYSNYKPMLPYLLKIKLPEE